MAAEVLNAAVFPPVINPLNVFLRLDPMHEITRAFDIRP